MLRSPLENFNKTDIHNQSCTLRLLPHRQISKARFVLKSGSSLQSHSPLQTYPIDRILPTSETHDKVMNFQSSDLQQAPAFAHHLGMEDPSVSFLTPTTFLSTPPFAPIHPAAMSSLSHTPRQPPLRQSYPVLQFIPSIDTPCSSQPARRFCSSRRSCLRLSDLQHVVFTLW